MYFEEKMIDGVMCFRTEPDGEWRPFDIKELSRRYAEAIVALNDDGWTYCGGRLPENGWYLTQRWDGSMRVEEYYFAVRARWAKNVVAYRPLLRLIQSIIRYLQYQIEAAYLCRDKTLFDWYSEGQEAFFCIIQEKPITRTQRVKDLQLC